MTGTSYWYMHTDQWRNDGYSADSLASPLAEGHLAGKHTADTIAQSARLGWMPFYPQFDAQPAARSPTRRRPRSTPGSAAEPGGIRRRARCTTARLQLGHRGRRRPGELAAHAGAVAVAT